METDKRILVYNTVTGKMLKNLQYSENNLLIPLEENESIAVVPSEIKLSTLIEEGERIVKTTFNRPAATKKNKSQDIDIAGPNRYIVPQRLAQSSDTVGKIIFGGQHTYASSLSGVYYPKTSYGVYEFFNVDAFSDLKLINDDHFQILNTNNTVLDGIYKVQGYSEKSLNALKVLGTTSGSSGSFNATVTGGVGFHMIRLQKTDDSTYGLSAAVEGCGVYQFGETITQSRYPVYNTGNVSHNSSVYKFGSSSAYFPNTGGGTAHIYVEHQDDFTPFESGSSVFFKLSFFVKFVQSSPASDVFLVGQKNPGNSGVYYLKYETSPKSFVFGYSSSDTGGDMDNSLTGLIPSLNLQDWNHIQIEVAPYKEVRMYVNGSLLSSQAISGAEEVFVYNDEAPFVMGCETDGTSPFYGYLDGVEMVWSPYGTVGDFLGGATGATMALGTTISVPTTGNTGANYPESCLVFNMNAPSGCQLFTEDAHPILRTEATIVNYDHDRRIALIGNYGTTLGTFSTTKGYVHGYNEGLTNGTVGATGNSEANHPFLKEVIGITALGANLNNVKKVIAEQQQTYTQRDYYYNFMSGNSGACGDFYNLFGVSGACAEYGSRTLTFSPTDTEVQRITKYVLQTGVSGVSLSSGYVYFHDADGVSFAVAEQYLNAFLADVNIYREPKENTLEAVLSSIEAATTVDKLATTGKNKIITAVWTPYEDVSLPYRS